MPSDNLLKDSKPFSLTMTSNAAAFDDAVEALISSLALKGTNTDKRHVKAILVNMVRLYWFRPDYWLYYTADSNAWRDKNRPDARGLNPLDLSRKLCEVVGAMVEAGYLAYKPGYNNRGEAGDKRWNVQSRIALTPKMNAFIRQQGLHIRDVRHHPKTPLIRMKVGERLVTKFKRNLPKQVRDSEKFIKQYNDFLAQQDIDLDIKDHPYFLDETSIYRVFNRGSWELGGRFAGAWWMNCRSDHRSKILINGEETIELDYAAQHINLLYALAGLPIPKDDPYTLPHVSREVVKEVCLILINAKNVKSAYKACQSNVNDGGVLTEEDATLFGNQASFEAFLKNKLFDKHKPILSSFGSDMGVHLMNIDSNICEKVLRAMTAKEISCLSVHDSFIVPQQHKKVLHEAMQQAYRDEGLGDYIPRIK